MFEIESKWPNGVMVYTALRDDGTAEEMTKFPSMPGLGFTIQVSTRPQTLNEQYLVSRCGAEIPTMLTKETT